MPLGDLISSPRRGSGHEEAPVYSITKDGAFIPSIEHYDGDQVAQRNISRYRLIHAGEVAFSTLRIEDAVFGIAPVDALISPMYGVFSVDTTKVSKEFLVHLLKSPSMVRQYRMFTEGSALHAFSLISLKKMTVSLPPREEQERIAALLSDIDTLIAAQEAKLDKTRTVKKAIQHLLLD